MNKSCFTRWAPLFCHGLVRYGSHSDNEALFEKIFFSPLMIIFILMRVAVSSACSFQSWLHISVEHRPTYSMVSLILPLLHYVIRPNGLQMCVIVFFVGLSMFFWIIPVGARGLSAHQVCVCALLHLDPWDKQLFFRLHISVMRCFLLLLTFVRIYLKVIRTIIGLGWMDRSEELKKHPCVDTYHIPFDAINQWFPTFFYMWSLSSKQSCVLSGSIEEWLSILKII